MKTGYVAERTALNTVTLAVLVRLRTYSSKTKKSSSHT
jgi:hypothetical protein